VGGGGVESNWVHSALRPQTGLLCQPQVIMMMEKLVERLAWETWVVGENLPQCRFVQHKPHVPARTRTRSAAVGSHRLTTWATARPVWNNFSQESIFYPEYASSRSVRNVGNNLRGSTRSHARIRYLQYVRLFILHKFIKLNSNVFYRSCRTVCLRLCYITETKTSWQHREFPTIFRLKQNIRGRIPHLMDTRVDSNTEQNKILALNTDLSQAEEYNGNAVSTWFISALLCFPRIHRYLSRGDESTPTPQAAFSGGFLSLWVHYERQ
jgi:hypothetical protein